MPRVAGRAGDHGTRGRRLCQGNHVDADMAIEGFAPDPTSEPRTANRGPGIQSTPYASRFAVAPHPSAPTSVYFIGHLTTAWGIGWSPTAKVGYSAGSGG